MAVFEIDGRDYPVPSVFQLTMGEAQVLFDYSGYTLEDFVPPVPGESDDKRLRQVRDPAFKRAMVHIAYRRGNPEAQDGVVRALVDGVQMLDVTAAMFGDDEPDPTVVSPTAQPSSSGTEGPSTSASFGRPSPVPADLPDAIPAPIGATG